MSLCRASTNVGEWTANISAKELEGEIVSRSEGAGASSRG